MHVQNAITVGLQIAKFFPVMKHHGEGIQQAVQAVADGTKGPGTPDVKLQALGYVYASNLAGAGANAPRYLRQIVVNRPKMAPGSKDIKWKYPSDFHPVRLSVRIKHMLKHRMARSCPSRSTRKSRRRQLRSNRRRPRLDRTPRPRSPCRPLQRLLGPRPSQILKLYERSSWKQGPIGTKHL